MKLALAVLFAFIVACNTGDPLPSDKGDILRSSEKTHSNNSFEAVIDAKQTELFVLKNHAGMRAAITNYGGRLVSLWVPDKKGKFTDIVIGFNSVQAYQKSSEPYFGAIIGRYANRIARGKFSLDGREYTLFPNSGVNSKHGGKKGYQAVVWDAKKIDDSTLALTYLSKDMEEGFPGNLKIKVTYSLTGANGLKCAYEAATDKKTVVNLTNHSFFNLNGRGTGSMLNHVVQIYADKYLLIDSGLIPTGEMDYVKGSPFEFTKPEIIAKRIGQNNEQLKNGKGYDHSFVLNRSKKESLNHAAKVTGDKSGIVMDIYTEEPGLQFYSGNALRGKNIINDGSRDEYRTAFAMETQHFPDSPNQPSFPTTVLKPGDKYKTTTIYKFSVTR